MSIQQEIAEALRIGATRCEDLQDSWESEYTVAYLGDEANKLRQLAARVEAARCETCVEGKGYLDYVYCDWFLKRVPKDHGCWQYEPKEKVK